MQAMIPPKRFDIFPLIGGCSEGLDAFRVFFKMPHIALVTINCYGISYI